MPTAALILILLAADLPANQITIDVDAASVGVTYARRVRPSVMVGGGIAVGPSPLLGKTFASNSHFDTDQNTYLLEAGGLQGFGRFGLASWLRLDAGLRVGVFVHGGEDFAGGPFVLAFASPAIGWRWFWIGPRLEAGMFLSESGGGRETQIVVIDYLTVRFAISWDGAAARPPSRFGR